MFSGPVSGLAKRDQSTGFLYSLLYYFIPVNRDIWQQFNQGEMHSYTYMNETETRRM